MEYYSVSYATFVVPLVKAVQEQQQHINQLESRIDELEAKVNQLIEVVEKDRMYGANSGD